MTEGLHLDTLGQHILEHLHEEFPTWNAQVLGGPADLSLPRGRHPLFYGSYDWHSSVHSHWALVRILRQTGASTPLAEGIVESLQQSFDPDIVSREVDFWSVAPAFFERPYGYTWFLALMGEVRQLGGLCGERWASVLAPLEDVILERSLLWLDGLTLPVRSGSHNQTAWSLMLLLDWARTSLNGRVAESVIRQASRLYLGDVDAPLNYEPSAEDFFSPTLNEAAMMAACLPASHFQLWIQSFLPGLNDGSLRIPPLPHRFNRADYLSGHLVALPLTRAFALTRIASALPISPAKARVLEAARSEYSQGLDGLSLVDYASGHWVASYAVLAATSVPC